MTYSDTPKSGSESDPLAWMRACNCRAGTRVAVAEAETGEPIDQASYGRIYSEAWQPRLQRLRFVRPVAPSNDFLARLAVTAGWVFRQPATSGVVGLMAFGIEVETLSYPKEALLALEKATGKEFEVEEISSRFAKAGEGEGPRLHRPDDPDCTYQGCLEDALCFVPTSHWTHTGLGAERICRKLSIPLSRFANLVESGQIPPGKRRELRMSGLARPVWVQTWKTADVETLGQMLEAQEIR